MRTTTIPGTTFATSIVLCSRMLFVFHQRSSHLRKVGHLFPLLSLEQHISSTPFTEEQQSRPPKSKKSDIYASSIDVSGVAKSVLGKFPDLFVKRTEPASSNASSLEEFLLSVSHLNPRITRKVWRKSGLEPKDVLELLLGFESKSGKLGIDVEKVGSLWGIFKCASVSSEHGSSFKHLDQSFKIMVGLLVRVGLFEDAECLLLAMDKEGILLDNHEIFSDLIEWHVGVHELEKSINMYDRMRGLNLVPSSSCYRTLVNYLVHRSETQLLFRVYGDMLEMAVSDQATYENVIQVLCKAGKVQDSRSLIKKACVHGIKPTSVVLDAIASRYCEKKDYDDLLSLFAETDCPPDVVVGNKIIHSLCQDYGAEEAFVFMEELEQLGFSPDAVTLGILIGWSCREGNLRNAFVCLSDVSSRGLNPHLNSYNALISGVFKHGMWNHAADILCEMDDKGVSPDMSTFRVLLAGYCKARRFDEVKVMIGKMVHGCFIELSPLEDPLSKAFMLLEINPLAVRVRRDNDVASYKTEFYDSMGNGLYLEGDVVGFDHAMTRVLDDSMVPDYNRLILKNDGVYSHKTAYLFINELVHWGQELSVTAFSTLLKRFRASNSSFKTVTAVLESMPKLDHEFDEETLNLLVQVCIRKGFVRKARQIYEQLVIRNLQIDNKTYSALVTGLCKNGNKTDVHDSWELSRHGNWLPALNDYRTLICALCQNDMLMEALFLFERSLLDYPHEVLNLSHAVLEVLCRIGLTKVASVLTEELLLRGHDVGQVACSHLLRGFTKSTVPDLDVLLRGYCAANDRRKAEEVLGAIVKKNVTISVSGYSKLVSLMCNEGRFNASVYIKDLTIKHGSERLAVYNILVFHLLASGNTVFVDMVLDEMQGTGLEFDNITYNFLVHGFSRCKALSRSLRYLTEMMFKGLKPSHRSLRAVTRLLCSARDFKKVLKLSREMETRGWVHCSAVQNEVVGGLLKMGKVKEAVNFLDKIIRKDLVPDIITYDSLIKQMCRCGRHDTAVDLLDTMVKKGSIPDPTSYDCLIQELCLCRKMEEALDLYTEMLKRKLMPSVRTREVLCEKLCDVGRASEAEKLIEAMVCVGERPSKVMFGCVVSRYRYERNFSKASKLLQTMQQFGYKPDFETHWSLISTLSKSIENDRVDDDRNFLSRLLSESGFSPKKGVDPNQSN